MNDSPGPAADLLRPAAAVDEHDRPEPDHSGSETALLTQFLDYQRATFAWRIRGLDDDGARSRTAASSLTLAGLAGHLAFVEDQWFTAVVARRDPPEPWASMDWEADADGDFRLGERVGIDAARALWEERCAASRDVVRELVETAGTGALDLTSPAWGGRDAVSLRWVLLHMIEEYARHNGHADLLREAVDGETGE